MNVTTWFVTAIIIMAVFALISNTSPIGLANIQFQFDAMTCPFPLSTGQDQLLLNGTLSFGMNIQHNLTAGVDRGTFYKCEWDNTGHATTFYAFYKDYQATAGWGTVPIGWFVYAQDWLATASQRIIGFFTLILFFLTPINFNILGYTISNIGGIGLMVIIGIYGFCYMGIGAFASTYVAGLISRLL